MYYRDLLAVIKLEKCIRSTFIVRRDCWRKARDNPVIMKLDSPDFKALFTPELTTLVDLFKNHGYEIRIAGGAVRDLLMKKQPKDLDFATTATPDEMKMMFCSKGIRMINTRGEKHGTITPRINNKENFEVTTLRIDVRTDGRHADVQFTKDWKQDASRRDLTINSMFLGLDGTVYDYFSGFEDLQKKRIAFVGDPDIRIKEDYLRILRYFRFYGRIADSPDKHEEHTLAAIKANAQGLSEISGERIWTELHKILEGNFAVELVNTMLSLGIGPYIDLPNNPNVKELNEVWKRSGHMQLQPMTLLAALFRTREEVMKFHSRIKLSGFERDLGLFVVEHREDKPSDKPIRPYQQLVFSTKSKTSDVCQWVTEVLKYRGDNKLMQEFKNWSIPRFPINGNMLKANKVPGGKVMGLVMQKLKYQWVDSDFKLTSEDLLELLPEIMKDIGDQPNG